MNILPTISKVVESILIKQLQRFLNKFLSPLLCGFSKGCITQKALLIKWQ